ncbi:hypothetical protein ACVBRP_001164 [Klebsiella pneumoniae]
MSILFNPELDSALNANGTESVKDIDAGLFQGVGQGVSTGFSNAGTSLQRIGLTTLGRGQMQVAAAQMQATANITGNEALSNAAQDVLSALNLQRTSYHSTNRSIAIRWGRLVPFWVDLFSNRHH